jgi:hypothetical protein
MSVTKFRRAVKPTAVIHLDRMIVQKRRSSRFIEELTDLIKAARLTTRTWQEFLDDFVDDKDLVLRIKAKLPRKQWSAYGLSINR